MRRPASIAIRGFALEARSSKLSSSLAWRPDRGAAATCVRSDEDRTVLYIATKHPVRCEGGGIGFLPGVLPCPRFVTDYAGSVRRLNVYVYRGAAVRRRR